MAPKTKARPRRSDTGRAAREQTRRRWTIVGVGLAALALLLVAGAAVLDTDGGERADVVAMAPREASQLIQENRGRPGFVILDVRTATEFSASHLPDAVNVDIDDPGFRRRLSDLRRDDTYVVYCHSGNRSARATALMADLGFPHVYDVRGGLTAWQQAGLPVGT